MQSAKFRVQADETRARFIISIPKEQEKLVYVLLDILSEGSPEDCTWWKRQPEWLRELDQRRQHIRALDR